MSVADQLSQMLALQAKFNSVALPTWREQPPAFNRAIWMECAELIDGHLPWKWWKKAPDGDITQAHIELVDIWHFLMSWSLVTPGADPQALLPAAGDEATADDRLQLVEALCLAALVGDLPNAIRAFWRSCASFDLSYELLYRLYIGKNALNHHRNAHGYKTGGYVKIWQGREDNQHLAELMDSGVTGFDPLVAALAERYRETAAA